jgi:hypothetical protein
MHLVAPGAVSPPPTTILSKVSQVALALVVELKRPNAEKFIKGIPVFAGVVHVAPFVDVELAIGKVLPLAPEVNIYLVGKVLVLKLCATVVLAPALGILLGLGGPVLAEMLAEVSPDALSIMKFFTDMINNYVD